MQLQLTREGRTPLHGPSAQPLLEEQLAPTSQTYGFRSSLVVFGFDRRGILADVSQIVTQEASNIVDVHSETTEAGEAALQFTVHVHQARGCGGS